MAWELEGLIARLLIFIACAGEQGCPLSDLVHALRLTPDSPNGTSSHHEGWYALPQDFGKALSEDGLSTVWAWIARRDDISVGRDRKYNHLSFRETLKLAALPPFDKHSNNGSAGDKNSRKGFVGGRSSSKTEDVRVFASEQTMWEAITGHSVDYKRVPRSEWLLLLGIASQRDQGILQGDLCRLVEQDKRSVPKRTDALVRKGYITKRTTLVRGTKTSKLWVKAFTPLLPRDTADSAPASHQEAEMNLSHQVLATNLDPVPWHSRWTGESVDYTALLTTIIATCREWDVMRMQDLKSKLGVLGMRWQMKVVSKVCRFLNARDAIRYVAAKLDNKVFKDCIRFNRDLDAKDWSIFLSTGRRAGKPSRYSEFYTDGGERADVPLSHQAALSRLDAVPPWSIDQPLPVTVAKAIMAAGEAGLTNPEVYGITLGASFTRFLSSVTVAMSTPGLQPPHLKHLQVKSEHSRVGKVASYRYSMQDTAGLDPVPTSRDFGFSPPAHALRSGRLENICSAGHSRSKSRGRPRKQRPEEPAASSHADGVEPMVDQETINLKDTVMKEGLQDVAAHENAVSEHVSQQEDEYEGDSQSQPTVRQQASQERPQPELGKPVIRVVRERPRRRGRHSSLIMRFEMSSIVLRNCLSSEKSILSPVRDTRNIGSRKKSLAFGDNAEDEVGIDASRHQVADQADDLHSEGRGDQDVQASARGIARGGGRGRGRGRRRGKDRSRGETREDGGSKSTAWVCDKCGGVWKNDIGLKYHLEKSRTTCNPSWDPSALEEKRRQKAELKSARIAASKTEAAPPELRPRRVKRKLGPDATTSSTQRLSQEEACDEDDANEVDIISRRPKYRKFEPDTPAKLSSFAPSQTPLRALTSQPRQIRALEYRIRHANPISTQDEDHSDVDDRQPIAEAGIGALRSKLSDPTAGSVLLPAPSHSLDEKKQEQEEVIIKSDLLNRRPRHKAQSGRVSRSKKVPRHEIADRIAALIVEMLQIHEGVLPGGDSLWHALKGVWNATYPAEPLPKVKDCQWALSRMLKTKQVREHWHGFQGHNGLFSKCQIISLPHLNAFAPHSMYVLDRIKQAHPALFVPDMFSALAPAVESREGETIRRGRRLLAGEVADLDAPVYAAQIAAKRGPDLDDDDLVGDSPKRRKIAAVVRNYQTAVGLEGLQVQRSDTHARGDGSRISPGLEDAGIQFLVPNTFLEDEHELPSPHAMEIEVHQDREEEARGTETQQTDELTIIDPQLFESVTEEAAILSPQRIKGRGGLWPALAFDHFEGDTSFTMQGWMPGARWFSWEGFAQKMKKHLLPEDDGAQPPPRQATKLHDRMKQRLEACMNLELTWVTPFVQAQRFAAGPHNLFINFVEGSTICPSYSDLSWPADEQLTIATAGDRLHLSETCDSGSSSDDNDTINDLVRAAADGRTRRNNKASLEASTDLQKGKIKRVALVTRPLSAIPQTTSDKARKAQFLDQEEGNLAAIDQGELLAAFVALRVLLGGADKAIDWGLLMHIFPKAGLKGLRRFWSTSCKEQALYIRKFTKSFQTRLIESFENEELPIPDFDNPWDYDWSRLIRWTMQIPRQEGFQLPQTRELLDNRYLLEEVRATEEDWREKFFHVQASIFSRFEAVTSTAGAMACTSLSEPVGNETSQKDMVDVAKSWIKSLCCTEDAKYSAALIKRKFLTLAEDAESSSRLLQAAIDDLTRERVINRSKKPPLGGRPFKLSEWYISTMAKVCQRSKYQEAAAFKEQIDAAFRLNGEMEVLYTLNDGAMMALTNLNAAGRIRIVLVDLPNIPFGFEPGNYESRKLPKSYYHFRLKAVPTDSYQYNNQIQVLRAVCQEDLPLVSPKGEIPQWVDFLGDKDLRRWSEILGAFCFAFATRGSMTIEGICSALNPVLEGFEARLMEDWGRRTGIIQPMVQDMGISVGEWWWLAVPWQQKVRD